MKLLRVHTYTGNFEDLLCMWRDFKIHNKKHVDRKKNPFEQKKTLNINIISFFFY